MDTSLCLCKFVLTLLLLCHHIHHSLSLVCNYCYQADIKEDCHLNIIQCKAKHVCTVETSLVSYKGRHVSDVVMPMYKMGCQHHSLCRDRKSSGVGPYGYAVVTKICCCNHRCEEPDGVGKGMLDNCPQFWDNATEIDVSSGIKIQANWSFWIAMLYSRIVQLVL